jgi:hypothetical protein
MSNIIPYTFTCVNPSCRLDYPNVNTTHSWTDKVDIGSLNMFFIKKIADLMYEFCSEIYGYGIHITSYDEFCSEYWKRQDGPIINEYYYICEYMYYDPNINDRDYWKLWHPRDHKDEIMKVYNELYFNL